MPDTAESHFYDLDTAEGRREYAVDTIFGAFSPHINDNGVVDKEAARPSVEARIGNLISHSPEPIISTEDIDSVFEDALQLAQEAAGVYRGITPSYEIRTLTREDFL